MDQTQYTPQSMKPNSSKPIIITLIIVLVACLIAAGLLGFAFKKELDYHSATRDDRDAKIVELEEKSKLLEKHAQVIQDADFEPKYWNKMQESANQQCYSTGSAILFNTTVSPEKNSDGSIKKYFAVGKYICNSGNTAFRSDISFVALQSFDTDNWEFTYGSGSADPNSLPSYIYDTDPSLFKRKYNNPNRF